MLKCAFGFRISKGRRCNSPINISLNIADAAAARAWLAAAPVTNAATSRLPDVALQVAFTYDGLKALGLSEEILRGFSDEFIVGMAGDESRSRRLGDVGPNDPSRWRWGRGDAVPHMMVLLYATPERLASREAEIKREPGRKRSLNLESSPRTTTVRMSRSASRTA